MEKPIDIGIHSEADSSDDDPLSWQNKETLPGKWASVLYDMEPAVKNPIPGILLFSIVVLAVSLSGTFLYSSLFSNPFVYICAYVIMECTSLDTWNSNANKSVGNDRRSGMLDLVLLAPKAEEFVVQGVVKAERDLWKQGSGRMFMASFPVICGDYPDSFSQIAPG